MKRPARCWHDMLSSASAFPVAVPTAEMIGTLRADLRRVEMTLGARIDARVSANDSLLRDQVHRDGEELRAEVARLQEDVLRCLAEVTERLLALDAKVDSARPLRDRP
jgi:hypothetical protein